MHFLKRYAVILSEGTFLLFIYYFSRLPLRDYDIWFHLKSGEVFVKNGLQFTDPFSHTAQGKEWIPYEWLFQIGVFLISQIGMWAIPLFIAVFSVVAQFLFLRILSYIFGIKLIPRLALSFLFFVSIYEFNTARPHVLAYSFIIVILFLILARIFKGRKWIWFSPLLVFIWTNLHSTSFLAWGFMLAFATMVFVQWIFQREKKQLLATRDLLLVAFVNFLVTISPPLGFLDYKLLWTFFVNREFLGNFIAEWAPTVSTLDYNPLGFTTYSAAVIITLLLFAFLTIKNRLFVQNLWAIPFVIMMIAGYTATRNLYLGSLATLLVFGWCTNHLITWPKTSLRNYFWIVAALVLIFASGYLMSLKKTTIEGNRLYYPVQSAEFAKRYLSGNMFNDYTYGGYILYAVYPNQKVFIDGRADVYVCCEMMQDYLLLALYKNLPDEEYKKFLNSFWEKYDISFAILSSQKHNVLRLIARHLSEDPSWALVFWDDDSQVFIKRDGKNDEIIKQLEAKYATPYLRNPYREGEMDDALEEYKRMEQVAKSARTSNASGFILMQREEYDAAENYFVEAINMDPTYESPYMNLAELEVKDGQINAAIAFYIGAKKLAGDRGLIYIRLGELILLETGDKERVRKIWEEGVRNTIDTDAKKQLNELLSNL